MIQLIHEFANDQRGATAIEYAIIASGIFMAIISVVGTVGTNLNTTFTSVNDGFPAAAAP